MCSALYGVSLALSLIEDASREQARIEQLTDNLSKRFPEDTVVRFNYLPTLRAQLAISRNDASSSTARIGVPDLRHSIIFRTEEKQLFLFTHGNWKRHQGET